MENNINLAKISTELGAMTITLEDRNGKRVLVGRTEDGSTEELIADQPQDGYSSGNKGIVDALDNIGDWYRDYHTWQLETLVDWRDYVGA